MLVTTQRDLQPLMTKRERQTGTWTERHRGCHDGAGHPGSPRRRPLPGLLVLEDSQSRGPPLPPSPVSPSLLAEELLGGISARRTGAVSISLSLVYRHYCPL